MHAIRLLYECKEIILTGNLTFPRPEREFLIRVRTGQFSLEQVLHMADELTSECHEVAEESSILPEEVDLDAVSKSVADSYCKMWIVQK